jgi:hypothetical protein
MGFEDAVEQHKSVCPVDADDLLENEGNQREKPTLFHLPASPTIIALSF